MSFDDDFGDDDNNDRKKDKRGGRGRERDHQEFGGGDTGGFGGGDRGGFGGGGGYGGGGGGGYRGGGGGGYGGGGGGYRGGGDRGGGGYGGGGGGFRGGGGGGFRREGGGGGGFGGGDRPPRAPLGDPQDGVVKFFNGARGFGFITPDGGGADVFVHVSAVERAGLTQLVEGQKVNFQTLPDTKGKGPKAVNLKVLD